MNNDNTNDNINATGTNKGVSFEEMYNKESRKFKFKAICTALSVLVTICFAFSYTEIGEKVLRSDSLLLILPLDIAVAIGYIAAISTGPLQILKTLFKCGKFAYDLVPILLVDLLIFVIALAVAVVCFGYFPVIFAGYNLYLAYLDLKVAESFLNDDDNTKKNDTAYMN